MLGASACIACSAAQAVQDTNVCGNETWSRTQLTELRETGFALPAGSSADALALALLPCLSDPDPGVRDATAYTGLATLMRGELLNTATVRAIGERLRWTLAAAEPDPTGFGQPFAALALAEVARVDRLAPFMHESERDALLDAVANYLAGVRDYRGFDPVEGWRHGVAHAADVLLQLALNPNLTAAQSERIRAAVATQVVPANAHFYRFGESERLARPILYLARRGDVSGEQWQKWLDALSQHPADAGDVYASLDGLAWRHNLSAFLNALFVNASLSDDDGVRALLPGTEAALRALP